MYVVFVTSSPHITTPKTDLLKVAGVPSMEKQTGMRIEHQRQHHSNNGYMRPMGLIRKSTQEAQQTM